MATIKVSDKMIERVFNEWILLPGRTDITEDWPSAYSNTISIYTSTFPAETRSSIDPGDGVDQTNANGDAAHRLVQIDSKLGHTVKPIIIDVTGNKITFADTNYVTAAATGTAAYITIVSTADAPGNTTALREGFTGTVGLPGSGADVVIGSTSIVAGQPFKASNITVTFPQVFTY